MRYTEPRPVRGSFWGRSMKSAIRITLLLSLALGGCSSAVQISAPGPANKALVVFLVRHAEKLDASEDPALSAAGHERAWALASALRNVRLQHIHSSDYTRTLDTAQATAGQHRLEIERYNPGDLPALAQQLRSTGGRHLVVGHSNTTPKLVELLGGDPGPAINEQSEYDRLYIVSSTGAGDTVSVLLRYGNAYRGQAWPNDSPDLP